MTSPRYPDSPFAFAVSASPARAPDRWADEARRAEDLGYQALLVPDHLASGGPLAATAVAGAATTSLRVGPLVMAVDFQHPIGLAREAITLDVLLRGRLELGLGAGWRPADYEGMGMKMPPAADRVERLRAVAARLRDVWHQSWADNAPDGTGLGPRPHRAAVTLVLGGGGRRVLEVAVEHADVVNVSASMAGAPSGAPLGATACEVAFARRLEWIVQRADRLDRWPVLQCLVFETSVTAHAGRFAAERVCPGFGLPVDEVLRSPLTLIGTVDELCEKLHACRASLGISYWVVKSAAMEPFAPVVERLAGT